MTVQESQLGYADPRRSGTWPGDSDAARYLFDQVDFPLRKLDGSVALGLRGRGVFDALLSVYESCNEPGWNGYAAEPVSVETYRHAYQFLELLPYGVKPPSVGVESDGHLTFEWYRSKEHVLSVSIGPDGMGFYAALLGNGSRRSGSEWVGSELVNLLLPLINRVFGA